MNVYLAQHLAGFLVPRLRASSRCSPLFTWSVLIRAYLPAILSRCGASRKDDTAEIRVFLIEICILKTVSVAALTFCAAVKV